MTDEPVPFGDRLRRFREDAGMTEDALAERAGLSTQGIAVLERGRSRRPYPHTVRALGDALDLSTEDHAVLLASVPGQITLTVAVDVELAYAARSGDRVLEHAREDGGNQGQQDDKALAGCHVQQALPLRVTAAGRSSGIVAAGEQWGSIVSHRSDLCC